MCQLYAVGLLITPVWPILGLGKYALRWGIAYRKCKSIWPAYTVEESTWLRVSALSTQNLLSVSGPGTPLDFSGVFAFSTILWQPLFRSPCPASHVPVLRGPLLRECLTRVLSSIFQVGVLYSSIFLPLILHSAFYAVHCYKRRSVCYKRKCFSRIKGILKTKNAYTDCERKQRI